MAGLKETKKYTFTVEGETEKWYFNWLEKQINACEDAEYKVSIVAKVNKSPSKFVKSQTSFSTPSIVHICDVESNEPEHKKEFLDILDQIDGANKLGKKIKYDIGYSNFTFELWIALHRVNCNGPITHRSQYIGHINRAFGEKFEDLAHYKKEDNFKRCLSKLTLNDVKMAIGRAERIMLDNESDPGKKVVIYKKFKYYEENPSLTVWKYVKVILDACGVKWAITPLHDILKWSGDYSYDILVQCFL